MVVDLEGHVVRNIDVRQTLRVPVHVADPSPQHRRTRRTSAVARAPSAVSGETLHGSILGPIKIGHPFHWHDQIVICGNVGVGDVGGGSGVGSVGGRGLISLVITTSAARNHERCGRSESRWEEESVAGLTLSALLLLDGLGGERRW